MTSKALANEAYLEEYNRLELELKQLQHELSDSVVLNDELTKVIAQKVISFRAIPLFPHPFSYLLSYTGGRAGDERQTSGVSEGEKSRRWGPTRLGKWKLLEPKCSQTYKLITSRCL